MVTVDHLLLHFYKQAMDGFEEEGGGDGVGLSPQSSFSKQGEDRQETSPFLTYSTSCHHQHDALGEQSSALVSF